jgi:DNA-binding response OmpR family regulator
VLVQNGYECAQENILKLDTNVGQSSVIYEKPSLIVVILSANTAKAMEYLYSLRSRIQTAYLVVGPTTDANLVLRALRAGVDDFVDDKNLDNELSVALSKLRNELPNQSKLGKVVAFAWGLWWMWNKYDYSQYLSSIGKRDDSRVAVRP